jgi:hypothetical protein
VYSNDYTNLNESISETRSKLAEHKQLLEDYENRSYVYGRTGLDIQSHTKANIRYYEELLNEQLSKLLE